MDTADDYRRRLTQVRQQARLIEHMLGSAIVLLVCQMIDGTDTNIADLAACINRWQSGYMPKTDALQLAIDLLQQAQQHRKETP